MTSLKMPSVLVESPNTVYDGDFIEANYRYTSNRVTQKDGIFQVKPVEENIKIRTGRKLNKLGVMLVGWGGNNGSTLTAAIEAHKHKVTWNTKRGLKKPDWFGSLTQSSTVNIGYDSTDGSPVYVPFKDVLPTVDPEEILVDGWDISSADLNQAVRRAAVLDVNLQDKLEPFLKDFQPRPSVYKEKFIAQNQRERADNVLPGSDASMVDRLRADIREMKRRSDLVVVVWTANTESLCPVLQGVHDTADNLLRAIQEGHADISPSVLFAVAAILEKCPFINGSPQNTFVPGVTELAAREGSWIAGDDFKTGQTRMKSVLVDFLVGCGIKPVAIASYNHLGNNDGRNLHSKPQFEAKRVSKTNVIDDIVVSNSILYQPGEKVDHTVVIEYLPYLGDSKRAMDEYTSEIMMGGLNTIVLHNVCEDSLLAAPVILDLVVLVELASRIAFQTQHSSPDWLPFTSELGVLSYMFKAPVVPQGGNIVNALSKQRACIINLMRACIGLPPEHHIDLESKVHSSLFRKP
ncbi:hypothetical protein GE061_010666 [Apolygus lucorum]|uniref:Inositol-3-phosphate synthase n=1 Tax=Apolygus lucorum TaxID=248454 RepID=A0A8S9XVK0_APOLU|nr:hypothetical protein GE061_010666 [Apolygus lucorum]